MSIRVGIAGWSIRREHGELFGAGESHLARYATRFIAVEINSCFYHPHRPQTYARWAASTPANFRFSVKLPRTITHEKRLRDCEEKIAAFAEQVTALGGKLGPILVQLPPSLVFDAALARKFFVAMRKAFSGQIAVEPRHPSWFGENKLLADFAIARVAADPAVVPQAGHPTGPFAYWRLHGSPRMYYSAYQPEFLDKVAHQLRDGDWCIFDNTAQGAAVTDALQVRALTS